MDILYYYEIYFAFDQVSSLLPPTPWKRNPLTWPKPPPLLVTALANLPNLNSFGLTAHGYDFPGLRHLLKFTVNLTLRQPVIAGFLTAFATTLY